jgi:hypothetical protein
MTILVLLSAWRAGVPARPGNALMAALAFDVVGALWRLA